MSTDTPAPTMPTLRLFTNPARTLATRVPVTAVYAADHPDVVAGTVDAGDVFDLAGSGPAATGARRSRPSRPSTARRGRSS